MPMSTLPVNVDDTIVWDTWLSLFRFPVVSVADEVGTFAALSAGALPTDELAALLDVDARALGVHLAMLAALGFVERREGRWRATAATRTWLHPQAAGYAVRCASVPREPAAAWTAAADLAPAGALRPTTRWPTSGNAARCRRNCAHDHGVHECTTAALGQAVGSSRCSPACARCSTSAVVQEFCHRAGEGMAHADRQPCWRSTPLRRATGYISAPCADRVRTQAANMLRTPGPAGSKRILLEHIPRLVGRDVQAAGPPLIRGAARRRPHPAARGSCWTTMVAARSRPRRSRC